MVQCFAPDCNHQSMRETCRFYGFPRGKAKALTRMRWILACSRADREPGQSSRLCSCHFKDGKKENGPTIFEKSRCGLFEAISEDKKAKDSAEENDDVTQDKEEHGQRKRKHVIKKKLKATALVGELSFCAASGSADGQDPVTHSSPEDSTESPGMDGVEPPRRYYGGRGREWATECHRLVQNMLSQEDSKPFREPVDVLKYPEYYTLITKPVDLSHIGLNLLQGGYSSLAEFIHDVRLMFTNYKQFFNTYGSTVFYQVHNLSSWFETEVTKMRNKVIRARCLPPETEVFKSPPNGGSVDEEPKPQKRMRGLEARIKALQEENSRVLADSMVQKSQATPQQSPNTNIILSIGSGSCTIVQGSDGQPSVQQSNIMTEHEVYHNSSVVGQGHGEVTGSTAEASDNAQTEINDEAAADMSPPDTSNNSQKSASIDDMMTEVKVNASSIWFGSMSKRVVPPVVVTEKAVEVRIRSENVKDEKLVMIKAEDLSRCAAHFGRSRNTHRHTLFFFVLPSFLDRLAPLINEPCSRGSVVVIFSSSLVCTDKAKLVHILWSMGKHSLFRSCVGGGQLFTELDHTAAVSLLKNINPNLKSSLSDSNNQRQPGSRQQSVSSSSSSSSPILPAAVTAIDSSRSASSAVSQRSPRANSSLTQALNKQPVNSTMADRASRLRMLLRCQKSGQWTASRFSPAHSPSSQLLSSPRSAVSSLLGPPPDNYHNSSREDKLDDPRDKCLPTLRDSYSLAQTDSPKAGTTSSIDEEADLQEDENSDRNVHSEPIDLTQAMSTQSCQFSDGESDVEIINPDQLSLVSEEPATKKICTSPQADDDDGDDIIMTEALVSLRCPITQQLMKHPMKNIHCGHCYDQQGVEELVKQRGEKARCPVIGCSNAKPLNIEDLMFDCTLWGIISSQSATDNDITDLNNA